MGMCTQKKTFKKTIKVSKNTLLCYNLETKFECDMPQQQADERPKVHVFQCQESQSI